MRRPKMSTRWRTAALAPVMALALAAPAAAASPWLHVRVLEDEGDKVSVNLPLSVVRVALSIIPEKISDGKHFKIDDHDHLSIAEMKALWRELRNSAEGDLVTVESADENVRVSREGELMLVRVDGHERGEEVAVEIPLSLVDALLAPEGEELDFEAAVEHLEQIRGDIVRVKGDDGTVRIWIDDNAGSTGAGE
jgi:hypothetical protein